MLAVVKTSSAPGADRIDVPEPVITRPDQVKIQVLATSICGTDYHIYQWDSWSAGRVKPPRIMGHEFAGRVVEVGSEVQSLKPGDYVSGESHQVCGRCPECLRNQYHVCANTRILGVDVDGCFAKYAVVPERSAWRNDENIPPHLACIQDPLGNAVHATMAHSIAGSDVAVLGCGPIGIFAVAVAQAAGASRVFATDTSPYRLELARKLGATETFNPLEQNVETALAQLTGGQGVDVALEMSGAPSAIQQSLRITRPGGSVSLMGIPAGPVSINLAEDLIFRGITVHGIVGRRLYETWHTMRALLASGRLNVEPVITHQLPISEYQHGMELMRDGLCGKVVFDMN